MSSIGFRWIGSQDRLNEAGVAEYHFWLAGTKVQVPMPNFIHAHTLLNAMQKELAESRVQARAEILNEIRITVKP